MIGQDVLELDNGDLKITENACITENSNGVWLIFMEKMTYKWGH